MRTIAEQRECLRDRSPGHAASRSAGRLASAAREDNRVEGAPPKKDSPPTPSADGVSAPCDRGKPRPGIPQRPDPYSPASRTPTRWRTPKDTPATPPSKLSGAHPKPVGG